MEIWKTIKDFENYQISNKGNVKSSKGIMKKKVSARGYESIGLRNKTEKQTIFLVHRLVAISFIENIDNKKYVNHIDGNKTNNNVDNLEWVTQSENMKHAYRTGLQIKTDEQIERLNQFAKAKRTPIRVINNKLGIDMTFNSIKEAGDILDCNEKTLRNSLKNRNKSRLGYEVTYL